MNLLSKWKHDDRGWPKYLPGGRIRTSTAALMVAFVALFWIYQNYQPPLEQPAPATQVVPPGFVPDPSYTWVPRTDVRRTTTTPPTTTTTTTTTTPTETTTETTTPTTSETSPTSPTSPTSTTPPGPPPLQIPGLPTPTPSPAPVPSPAPGQGPMVTPAAPTL